MKKILSTLLCGLLLLSLLTASVICFAEGIEYTIEQTYVGGVYQPGDTLNFKGITEWASLTALWGVKATFLDYDGDELAKYEEIPDGSVLSAVETPAPTTLGTVCGWVCDEDVTLVNGTVIPAGKQIPPADVNKILMNKSVVLTAKYAGHDGSITIENANMGDDYAVCKLFDLTYSDDAVSYVFIKTDDNTDLYGALTAEGSPFVLEDVGDGEYTVTIAEGADISDIIDWSEDNLDLIPVIDSATAETPVLVFDDLPYGYYFVTSSLGSIVTIDSTMKDVEVIDKNQSTAWGNNGDGKVIVIDENTTATENTAKYGDTVCFDIAIDASNYEAEELITYFYITDVISDGFDYVLGSNGLPVMTVTVGDKQLTLCETLASVTADDCFVTMDGDRSFTVTIKWAALKDGALSYIYDEQFNDIHIGYSATVNTSAVIGEAGNPNTANYSFDVIEGYDPEVDITEEPTPDPDPTPDHEPKQTDTYVYAIGIQKLNESGAPLAGATFRLEGVTVSATAVDGIYAYDANGTADLVMSCDGNGLLVIKGLDAGDYVLHEVTPPDGYNKTNEDLEMTVEEGDPDITGIFSLPVADYLPVVNAKGQELPATGGFGTKMFIVGGGLLLLAAGIFLLTNVRLRKNDLDEPDDPEAII